MANFGQMLSVAQAYGTPEQQRKIAETQSMRAESEVKDVKRKQMEELEALMEQAMKEAESKKGRFGNLGDLGKVVGLFNPMIGAGLSSIGAGSQARGQQKALKALMNDPRFAKYKGSYLSDPTKQFQEKALALSKEIDPLKTGAATFTTALASGKAGKKLLDPITGNLKQMFQEKGSGVLAPEVASDFIGPLEKGKWGLPGDPLKNLMANIKGGGGLEQLFEGFDVEKALGEAFGAEGKLEELGENLPMLLKMFGQGGGLSSFDFSELFKKYK